MENLLEHIRTFSPSEQYPENKSVCRLKNNAARLITINTKDEETGVLQAFRVLPGMNEPTNAPAFVLELPFVVNALKTGDLIALPLEN